MKSEAHRPFPDPGSQPGGGCARTILAGPRLCSAVRQHGARLLGTALLLFLALWAAGAHVPYDVDLYDEGLIANGGVLAMSGRLPAADYYAPYPPGAFVALALAFREWGVRLLVERWFAAALAALVAALGFWLISGFPSEPGRADWRARGSAGLAGVAAALLLVSRWLTPVTGGALVLVLASGIALRAALPKGRPESAYLCGALIGAAALWRLDFGLYAMIAGAMVWVLHAGQGEPSFSARRRGSGALALGLGALIVCVPVLEWLVERGGHRAAESLFWWPLTSTAAAHLPWTRYWAAFLAPLSALVMLLAATPALRRDPVRAATAHWLLVVGLGFLAYSLGRTHASHLLPLRVISLLLAALAAGVIRGETGERAAEAGPAGQEQPLSRSSNRLPDLTLAAFLLLGISLSVGPFREIVRGRDLAATRRASLPGLIGRGVYPPPRKARDYARIVGYLRHEALPGARLFCGASRHDLFLKDDNLAYFLSGRESGTYYWCLDAGVTSTLPVQKQMARELEAAHVELLLIRTSCANHEPNAGSRSSGVHLLDDYLRRHYEPIATWDDYQLSRRRPISRNWRLAHHGRGGEGRA